LLAICPNWQPKVIGPLWHKEFCNYKRHLRSCSAKESNALCAAELQMKLKVKTISAMKFYVCYFRVNGETSILKLPPVTTNLLNSLSATVLNPLLTFQSVKLFELRNAQLS
jgi:hypothetical protein